MDGIVYTTKPCNHSFSDAILDMIKRSRTRELQCPTPNCNFVLTEQLVERDKGLEQEIKLYLEREKLATFKQEDVEDL